MYSSAPQPQQGYPAQNGYAQMPISPPLTYSNGSTNPPFQQQQQYGQQYSQQTGQPEGLGPPPGHDTVPAEQHRYLLQNFRIAHETVEKQRKQMEEQEKQVAILRQRIAVLEGGDSQGVGGRSNQRAGGQTVDDFSIRSTAAKLEKLINRWAAEVVSAMPNHYKELYEAAQADIGGPDVEIPTGAIVQNIVRHALAETISEGIINNLIVTNNPETNVQLSRIHDHIFQRDTTVASVWRRQTFSAAVEAFTPEMSAHILKESIPSLLILFSSPSTPPAIVQSLKSILDSAYDFSRMLHASKTSSAGQGTGGDAFYRSFVPELSSVLYPKQIELLKRCRKHDMNQPDVVGGCAFPGLVKVTQVKMGAASGEQGENTIIRRAQVFCECALHGIETSQ